MPLKNLVEVCLDKGHPELWREFVSRVQPMFARIAYRISAQRGCADGSEVDDIVQNIFLKLGTKNGAILRLLPGDTDAAVFAYFKAIAANAARDYYKSKHADKRDSDQTVSLQDVENAFDFDTQSTRRIDTEILLQQVDAALEGSQRDRTIFWLYYRQGFTAKEIANIPAIALTAKGVESLIHRLTSEVRKNLVASERMAPKGNDVKESF